MTTSVSSTTSLGFLLGHWEDQEDGALLLNCLEYLDVVSLIQKKSVCKKWKQLCTESIDNKCIKKKSFQSREELRLAVNNYSPEGFNPWNLSIRIYRQSTPIAAEEIASTYGYPINKWDVSNITTFTRIFEYKHQFNEPIGSWDVSNATIMYEMFHNAESFNQDISSWDISNVANTGIMFRNSASFNQDISSWNVSNVTSMYDMFQFATSFNQDISSWDTSNVKIMSGMFEHAASFNQDLSSWDTSSVNYFHEMFYGCPFDASQLPWFSEEMLEL